MPDRVFGGGASETVGPARPGDAGGAAAEATAGRGAAGELAPASARSWHHVRGARLPTSSAATLPLTTQPVTVRLRPVAGSPPKRTAPGRLRWGLQSRAATAADGLPLAVSSEPCVRRPLPGGGWLCDPIFLVTTPSLPPCLFLAGSARVPLRGSSHYRPPRHYLLLLTRYRLLLFRVAVLLTSHCLPS